ncbi:hypothetical protein, partial [Thomasclavelia cocleata]|uniref:hypothetical protein n=1 Tax=Thomasclavelia cocleata TaxID=69824 RepID=UPI002431655E
FNGRTSAFQADYVGSIPIVRPIFSFFIKNEIVFFRQQIYFLLIDFRNNFLLIDFRNNFLLTDFRNNFLLTDFRNKIYFQKRIFSNYGFFTENKLHQTSVQRSCGLF